MKAAAVGPLLQGLLLLLLLAPAPLLEMLLLLLVLGVAWAPVPEVFPRVSSEDWAGAVPGCAITVGCASAAAARATSAVVSSEDLGKGLTTLIPLAW